MSLVSCCKALVSGIFSTLIAAVRPVLFASLPSKKEIAILGSRARQLLTFVAGGGIQSTGKTKPSNVDLGEDIILAGLLVQVFFFGFFIITGAIFHFRLNRVPTAASQSVPWKSHMMVLYATNSLIMIRSVFRVIEYAMGNNGYLLRHEVFLYVFDSVLMFAVMVAYIWKYPSEITELLRNKRGLQEGGAMMQDLGDHQRLETPHKNTQYVPVVV